VDERSSASGRDKTKLQADAAKRSSGERWNAAVSRIYCNLFRISLLIAFRVAKTPSPSEATASKLGT